MQTVMNLLMLTLLLYKRAAGIFIGYSSWLLFPIALSYLILLATPEGITRTLLLGAVSAGEIVLSVWVSVTLMLVTGHLLLQDPVTPEHLAKEARGRLGHAFVVALLVMMIQLVGFVLFIIPGIIMTVWYAFAQAETVLNREPALVALTKSRNLSRGRFWTVLARLFAGTIVLLGVYFLGTELLARLLLFVGVHEMGIELLVSALSVLYLPLLIIYSVALYLDLKRGGQTH